MQIFFRRVLLAIPTLFVLSLLVFLMLELTPGDVTTSVLDDAASSAAAEALRADMGYNLALPVRYVRYLGGVLRGDMGVSARSGLPVSEELARRLPYTLQLAGAALTLAVVVGVTLGTLAALHHNRPLDTAITGFVSLAMAAPTFWVALLLVSLFSMRLGWLPVFGADTPRHLILPAVSAGLALAPGIVRMTRTSLLEVLEQPFVLVARSKGISGAALLWRHIRPVAAIPVVTYIGLQAIQLISSVVVIEIVFNFPGLGGLAVQAVLDRDPHLLQGVTLLLATLTFTILLVVDLLVVALDPRIEHQAV